MEEFRAGEYVCGSCGLALGDRVVAGLCVFLDRFSLLQPHYRVPSDLRE